MAKCAACGKFLSPTGCAACTSCPGMFHRGCVGIPDNASIKKDWICPDCKKGKKKYDNSSTPVKGLHDSLVPAHASTSETVVGSSPQVGSEPSTEDTDLRAMRCELAAYMTEVREFRNEFRASMARISERMIVFERRLEALESREAPIAPVSGDFAELQQTVVRLTTELNDRDQDSLLSDLDIGSLPEERGENVSHTFTVLAAKLGVSVDERDIVFAERIGAVDAEGRARRIIVRLSRRHVRDEVLRAARVRRHLTSADIGVSGPPRRFYINERLTRANRQLFNRAREECRKRQWRYCWTRRGRVYVRQNDGKPAFPIRVEADFSRVFGTEVV